MKAPTTSEISHNSHGAKSVLVTGATRGIGRAIADELGRDHHIIVGGRHQEAVDNVVSELPNASPLRRRSDRRGGHRCSRLPPGPP